MRVVVTGTRRGRADVGRVLAAFVDKHGLPELFILGDQRGVDEHARRACETLGWSYARIAVQHALGSPGKYHDRNERMAALAGPGDWCLAFPDADSRGTWDCVGRARDRGLTIAIMPYAR